MCGLWVGRSREAGGLADMVAWLLCSGSQFIHLQNGLSLALSSNWAQLSPGSCWWPWEEGQAYFWVECYSCTLIYTRLAALFVYLRGDKGFISSRDQGHLRPRQAQGAASFGGELPDRQVTSQFLP